MSATIDTGFMTPEEYLAIENCAETKSEYVAGRPRAMAGASPEHIAICCDLAYAVERQVRGTACCGWNNDLRLWIEPYARYYYPDWVITCGTPLFELRSGQRALLNPAVLFEVFSPTTESIDREEKLDCYMQLESLSSYVLIAQTMPRIEVFTRGENGIWHHIVAEGPDAEVSLPVAGCTLRLADIYEHIRFTENPPGSQVAL